MTEQRTIEQDPILGDDGYPHEDELRRIREWPWDAPGQTGFRALMDYLRRRWQHAEQGYWEQQGDRFSISTAGWSGNESLIEALEQNQMFQMLCPVSWRRGGHYVYDVRQWDDNPEKGKRRLLRDPATPLNDAGSVDPCDRCVDRTDIAPSGVGGSTDG